MYLQDGQCKGESLVPPGWIAKTTKAVLDLGDGRYYAHHWWRQDFVVNGVVHNLNYAEGNGRSSTSTRRWDL